MQSLLEAFMLDRSRQAQATPPSSSAMSDLNADSDCPMSPISEWGGSEADFPCVLKESSRSSSVALLSAHKITTLPNTMYYIPNFITAEEEKFLLDKINRAPLPHWTQLSHRRLITYPSALTPNNILLASPLPLWLSAPYIPRMQSLSIWSKAPHSQPNHVLINEYQPGEGIMPHEDGPAYYPMVATISLGCSIVLDIFEKDTNRNPEEERVPKFRILQEPRSLLITTDDMYSSYLHGVARTTVDENLTADTIANWELLGDTEAFQEGCNVRSTRTSLTYRDVWRVSNLSGKFFGRR